MLLAACEGRRSRYEVCEHSDGYLVQMRDIETGDLNEDFATLFRTMPVAFAYAEMSAAIDICAAGEDDEADSGDDAITIDVEAREQKFIMLSDRLGDTGLSTMRAWERAT